MDFSKKLMQKIALPEEAQKVVETIQAQIGEDGEVRYQKIEQAFFNGEDSTFLAEEWRLEKEIPSYQFLLWLCIRLAEHTKQIYTEREIEDSIFYDTMTDITIWVNVCKRDFGIWGLREYGWLTNHLAATLFRLGRMQFELISFDYEDYTENGITVKKGDTVINMHIPEGDALTKEKRLDSYRKAYAFFGKRWFVCDSWLLYPAHRDFLPATSNLLDFMNDFTIIDASESTNPDNLWRIFDRRDAYIPSELPRNTRLRKAYAEHWEKHHTTGNGFGIFLYTPGE